jgi:predicted ATP-dependent endonuclease of OLD family
MVTTHTNLFIEEPEQNLFPKTQRDLVYQLVKTINANPDHTLTLTTHSPYILSSINNLIYASQVSNEDNSEAVASIIPQESHIGYEKVQAFYVDNGEAESIMDSSVRQIKAERIDEISQVLNEEYDQLLALED